MSYKTNVDASTEYSKWGAFIIRQYFLDFNDGWHLHDFPLSKNKVKSEQ